MKTNLCISFSQQKNNPCKMGDTEQDHCYHIAKSLRDKLETFYGDQLNLFLPIKRDGTDSTNLRDMVQEANAFFRRNGSVGFYLEIHTDAGGYGEGASGLYVSSAGLVFMRDIIAELSKATPWEDIGMRNRTNLHSLNATLVPAGIVELSFHDNVEEAKWIHNTAKVVDALALGIAKSLNLKNIDVNVGELKKLKADVDKINAFLHTHFKNFKL